MPGDFTRDKNFYLPFDEMRDNLINIAGQENIKFISSNSYADGSELELLISTEWDGTESTIQSSSWETLSANIVSDGEFYQNWVDSGLVDLSLFSGNGYIAFKYVGSGQALFDGTYEIDDFQVLVQN